MSRHAPSSRMGQIGRCSRQLALGIVVFAPVVSTSAVAAPPVTGLGSAARLVSDEEMGEMRGRYIAPEQLNFLGIRMLTSWQTEDGNVLTASLEFEVDVNSGQFDPNAQLWASWSGACADVDCDDSLNIPNTTPDGLNSVTGAVQTTEISGNGNDVVNLMSLRIGDYNADSVGFEGNATSEEITTPVKEVSFANGFAVKFEKGSNSLGMILQGPGPAAGADGQAIQGINGGAANQIAQNIQLMGDANAIHNSLDVFIGIDQLPAMQLAVENALTTMKGWGF